MSDVPFHLQRQHHSSFQASTNTVYTITSGHGTAALRADTNTTSPQNFSSPPLPLPSIPFPISIIIFFPPSPPSLPFRCISIFFPLLLFSYSFCFPLSLSPFLPPLPFPQSHIHFFFSLSTSFLSVNLPLPRQAIFTPIRPPYRSPATPLPRRLPANERRCFRSPTKLSPNRCRFSS